MTTATMAAGIALACAGASAASDQPGKGVKVSPLKSSIAEESFQTLIVMKALEKLGYDVQPFQEVEYPTAHVAIANGDATFLATHWKDRKSTRLNSSHLVISYAVFCLKKKNMN